MADRTVSVSLRARVSAFVSGMGQAQRSTEDLSRQMQQTGAYAAEFRRRLEAAAKALPKIEIDADSSPAEIKFAQLRAEMEKLADKQIGIDISAADAQAQLREIERELEKIQGQSATIDVKADIGAALAELRAVDSEIARVDGQTARVEVDADVAGALSDIALVGAALASLPTVTTLAAGVGGLAGAFTAAGVGAASFSAVAVPSVSRINKALDEQEKALLKARRAAGETTPLFNDLSKAEKALAKDIKSFTDEYEAWQRSLQPQVFPVIAQGLDLMRQGLQAATPLARSASGALLTLGKDAETALRGPFWQEFLDDVNTQIPVALTGLGRSFGNVVTGIAGILDAFLPFTPTIVGGVEQATRAFSEWGQNLEDNPGFKEFIEFVKREAPQVWELIKNVAKALGNVAEAVGPLGVGAFAGLNLLAELVAGMDPGHIQAIALAIGAIKLATMGMSGIAAWQNLAGGLTATGAAAGKAQGKMAAFGKAAIGVSAGVIGLELLGSAMNNLAGQSEGMSELTLALTELGQTGKWAGDLGEQWGGTFDDATKAAGLFGDGLRELQDPSFGEMFWLHPLSELTALLPGIDSTVDQLEQKFSDMDKTLAGMVASGNAETAARAFEQLAKQAAAQGIPVEKLNQLLPTYNQSLRVAGNAAAEAAAGVDTAKQKMDGFNTSLDTFAGRTDALTAMSGLKAAFNEARDAINAANGRLEASVGMTDKQRAAVALAREQFAGYIEKVKAAADGAQTLTGKTSAGTRAVLEQLPQLAALAGKNQEAREQVLKLAEAYGISREDAIKAMSSAKGLRDMLAQLKSKEIKVTADTAAARQAIKDLLNIYIKPIEIPVSIKAPATPPKKRARGGIDRYTMGGIDYAAASGMQLRPQPPGVVSKPTVLFGEGSSGRGATEAFIPYESRYRKRAVDLLSQVADDFGLEVYSRNAANRMSDAGMTIDATGMQVSTGLDAAMGVITGALGEAGTLTSAIEQVGATGTALVTGWTTGAETLGDSVTAMGSTVGSTMSEFGAITADSFDLAAASTDALTVSVQELVGVIGSAAFAEASGNSKSKSSSKSKAKSGAVGASAKKEMLPRKGKSGGVSASAKKEMLPRAKAGMVEGSEPGGFTEGFNAGDFVSSHASSLSMGAPVNSSKVSAPQQVPSSGYRPSGGGVPAAGGSGGGSGSGGSSVNFYGTTIRENVDAAVVTAQIGQVLDSRG